MPLVLFLPPGELFDEEEGVFTKTRGATLKLEHSLLSVSKWESEHCVPFFDTFSERGSRKKDLFLSYIKAMTIGPVLSDEQYLLLSSEHMRRIHDYIDSPHSASNVRDTVGARSGEYITSELIYYWMVTLNIPFECEKWNINRLMMLIRICNAKNKSVNKMSERETLSQYHDLNQQRLKELGTSG